MRKICRTLALNRSLIYRKCSLGSEDTTIKTEIRKILEKHPDHGFWICFKTLRKQGRQWNHKRVYRIYCELGYNITRHKKKKLPPRQKRPLEIPTGKNLSWSMDFMSDSLSDGRRIRILNIIDDFNREALLIEIAKSITAESVITELMKLKDYRGLPQQIRVDNGPEFISKKLVYFCRQNGVELQHIQPGKPMQNAYVERFNGTFRREVLDQNIFYSIKHVREIAETWRKYYNYERPHSALDDLAPLEI